MFRGGKILTLEQTLEDQQNLNRLCTDRGMSTVEKFGGNGFYGVANIYKQYANFPLDQPLSGVVLHGVSLHATWLWMEEARTHLKFIYCYPEFRRELYEKHGKEIILAASPFVYVTELLKAEPEPEREGLIFFPVHSSHHITSKYSYKDLANKLSDFDDKYKPITVCLYWKDFLLGAAKPFQEKGFKIVSAGHMFDNLFMYRFYHLCSMHKYASGLDTQSQIFYSIQAGCIYFITKFPYELTGSAVSLNRDTGKGGPHQDRVARMFCNPVDIITLEQREAVDYYLGVDYFKSKKEFKDDLLDTRF